jgi:hypothetical protein
LAGSQRCRAKARRYIRGGRFRTGRGVRGGSRGDAEEQRSGEKEDEEKGRREVEKARRRERADGWNERASQMLRTGMGRAAITA